MQSSGIGVHGDQFGFSYRVLDAGAKNELRVTERTPLYSRQPALS